MPSVKGEEKCELKTFLELVTLIFDVSVVK